MSCQISLNSGGFFIAMNIDIVFIYDNMIVSGEMVGLLPKMVAYWAQLYIYKFTLDICIWRYTYEFQYEKFTGSDC